MASHVRAPGDRKSPSTHQSIDSFVLSQTQCFPPYSQLLYNLEEGKSRAQAENQLRNP